MRRLPLGHDARGKVLFLEPDEAKAHTHLTGSSGSGKSKFLESIIRHHLRNRQGFCLADPHGTLFDDVVAYCAHYALNQEFR